MAEAKKRGLSNVKTTPEALHAFVAPKALALFEETGILSHREAEARLEVSLEQYVKKVQIESRVLGDLVNNHIVPATTEYQNRLIANAKGLADLDMTNDDGYAATRADIMEISGRVSKLRVLAKDMLEARKACNSLPSVDGMAAGYCDKVKPFFDLIRYEMDKLEQKVDNDIWPLAKYQELLFSH